MPAPNVIKVTKNYEFNAQSIEHNTSRVGFSIMVLLLYAMQTQNPCHTKTDFGIYLDPTQRPHQIININAKENHLQ